MRRFHQRRGSAHGRPLDRTAYPRTSEAPEARPGRSGLRGTALSVVMAEEGVAGADDACRHGNRPRPRRDHRDSLLPSHHSWHVAYDPTHLSQASIPPTPESICSPSDRVLLDSHLLVRPASAPPGLSSHLLGHSDLPDIVQQRSELDHAALVLRGRGSSELGDGNRLGATTSLECGYRCTGWSASTTSPRSIAVPR